MSNAALFPWLLLFFLFSEKKKAKPVWPAPLPAPVSYPPPPLPMLTPAPAPLIVHTTPAPPVIVPVAPPAWPAALPPGLPPFPGPGWVPDSPPGPGVVARAFALLPQLWSRGEGATATEQTAGRWITYVARMVGTKKSVIAYKLGAVYGDMSQGGLAVPSSPATNPSVVPAVYTPASSPAPSVPSPATPSAPGSALPLLKLTHPNTKGPSVVYLQQKLGLTGKDVDGVFGSGTDRLVRAFQASHFDPANGQPLKQDGVVGPATWRALG